MTFLSFFSPGCSAWSFHSLLNRSNNLILKQTGEGLEYKFLQTQHTNGQQGHEQTLHTADHREEWKPHEETPPHGGHRTVTLENGKQPLPAGMRAKGTPWATGGNENGRSRCGKQRGGASKTETRATVRPSSPTAGAYPEDLRAESPRKSSASMLPAAAVTTAKTHEQLHPRCPSRSRRKMQDTHTTEYEPQNRRGTGPW